jgi:transposase
MKQYRTVTLRSGVGSVTSCRIIKKAVANALCVSVSTVKRYIKRYPDFPAHRRGGTIYVAPEALKAWVEHQSIKKCPECGAASRG